MIFPLKLNLIVLKLLFKVKYVDGMFERALNDELRDNQAKDMWPLILKMDVQIVFFF